MIRKTIRKNLSSRTRARIARWFAMLVTASDALFIGIIAGYAASALMSWYS